MSSRPSALLIPMLALLGACAFERVMPEDANAAAIADGHAGHDMGEGLSVATRDAIAQAGIAPGAAEAAQRLQDSPRHAEWAMVPLEPGSSDSIAAFVVYPERRDNAPVVVVIHEIFGLSTWVRSVADQLAADGFIAIAPDLLSIERGGATTDSMPYAEARAMIRGVSPAEMNAMVAAVANYGMALPAATDKYGVVGYCWGGSASFNHAVFDAPGLSASVVYYGSAPSVEDLAKVQVPVLGLYADTDQRVNATIGRADSTLKANGVRFEQHVYPGARHGFLRAQDDSSNAAASRQAWPRTVAWFKEYLG